LHPSSAHQKRFRTVNDHYIAAVAYQSMNLKSKNNIHSADTTCHSLPSFPEDYVERIEMSLPLLSLDDSQ
jgi:hypothetical protein